MPNPDIPKENILGKDSVYRWTCVFQDVINPGLQDAKATRKMPKCAQIQIYNLLSINYVLSDDIQPQSLDLLKAEIKKAVNLLRSLNFDAEATFKLEGLFDKSAGQKPVEHIEEARKRVKSDLRLRDRGLQLVEEHKIFHWPDSLRLTINPELEKAEKSEDIPPEIKNLLNKLLEELPHPKKLQQMEQYNSLKEQIAICVTHLKRLKYYSGIITALENLINRTEVA